MSVPHIEGLSPAQSAALKGVLAVVGGALLVTLGAQMAVPLPGTPVPLTLQVPAVLIVGGLLGPRAGAASLVLYVALGAAGLPVFAPLVGPAFDAPVNTVSGVARLFGPTGGYLLAFPVAAAVVGLLAADGRTWLRVALAVVFGMVIIHLGGVSQLAVLGGDLSTAIRIGSLPFLPGDALKLIVASLVIRRFAHTTHTLL